MRALFSWILAFASITLFFASTAPAHAGSCYSQDEFEADRGLRLHEDVEVIMLTCRWSTRSEDLRKLYATFLQKNSGTIRKWENTIARSFASTGGSRNEVVDNFRTRLANEKAGEAAHMGPKPFCKQWADFVPYAAGLTAQQMFEYLRAEDSARPTRKPKC